MKTLVSLMLAIILGIATASPATQTDLQQTVMVSVEIDTPLHEIKYGSPLELRCVVVGLAEEYFIQWQYSTDLETWFDIDCHDEVYSFLLNDENAQYYYRVRITC